MKRGNRFIDLTRQKFSRLTVIRQDSHKNRKVYWECLCDCGNTVSIVGYRLRKGVTKSCGCLNKESTKNANTKHGMSHTKEHAAWCKLKERCLNKKSPDYHNYGGRGINISTLWINDFLAFYKHIGPSPSKKHQIDRINNNRGYEPGNVRWATSKVNGGNRRTSKRWFIYGYVYERSKDAAIACGVSRRTIYDWCASENIPECYSEFKYPDYHRAMGIKQSKKDKNGQ